MNKFQYSPPKNSPKSSEELIDDLCFVAKKLKTEKLSQSIYSKHGKYSRTTIGSRFGNWNKALKAAGLKPAHIMNYSDEILFENILDVWQRKGAQPTRRDINSTISKISSAPYIGRFNSWSNAIKQFIDYANNKEIFAIKKEETKKIGNKTNRDPSLRLRFHVLKRDNFSCVQCGASPAKDQRVVLHIDHIKPYSKGGETEISNLQTLCQNCNLGKSNIE